MGFVILVVMCSLGGLFVIWQVRAMMREGRPALPAPAATERRSPADAKPPRRVVHGWLEWGAYFLEADDEHVVMFVLPHAHADGLETIRKKLDVQLGARVRSLVVINDPAVGGHLWGSAIRAALGLTAEEVYATAPGASIDRHADARDVRGRALPGEPLEVGELVVDRLGGNAVIAAVGDLEVVVGAALKQTQLAEAGVTHVVGTLAEAITDLEVLGRLRGGAVVWFASVPPRVDADALRVLEAAGVPTRVVEAAAATPAWVPHAIELVTVARKGDSDRVAALVAEHPSAVVPALVALAIDGDLVLAEAIATIATPTAAVLHQRSIIASLRGDRDAMLDHLRAALALSPDHVPALVDLALARAGAPESLELADRAATLAPDDALARQAPIRARLAADDIAGARAKLAALTALVPEERIVLEAAIARAAEGPPAETVDIYPMLAQMAADRGRALLEEQQLPAAVKSLERARELDPTSLSIAGDLGFALSRANRDREAIALYNRTTDTLAGGVLLRFNRGNARRRIGELDGAIADFRHLVEHVPELVDARIALVATLAEARRLDDARRELDALVAIEGVPPQVVEALRATIPAS